LSRSETGLRLAVVRESVGPRFLVPACHAGQSRENACSRAVAALPRAGRPALPASGWAAKPPFLRLARWKARSLSTRLAFRSQGSRRGVGFDRCHDDPGDAGPRFRAGWCCDRRSVERRRALRRAWAPVRGSLLLRQRRRSRCEGPAWRAVGRNVPPFFRAGAFRGSEGVGSASLSGKRACGVMATSARTRRLLLYHGRVAPLNEIL